MKDVAERAGVTTPAVYIALGKARETWTKHPAISDLQRDVRTAIEDGGGALPLRDAARNLLERIGYDRTAPEETTATRAAALVRLVAELEKNDDAGLRYIRLHEQPYVCLSEAHAAAARALGDAADLLASRDVVSGPGESARVLAEAVAGTPLEAEAPARLVEIAASASARTARSTRLEIYPRGMAGERALALSASLLKGGMTPNDVTERVALRYPDAAALPARPALDALLSVHGLVWVESAGTYERPDAVGSSSLHTRASSIETRFRTALPSQALSMEPDAVVARQFDERLRNAVERRYLRVLGVPANRAREAAFAMGDCLGVRPKALDKLLIEAMQEEMRAKGIRTDDIVHDADRAGRAGKDWANLLRLAQAAAEKVAAQLLPPKEPLLLVQLGPIVRYRLDAFRTRLLEASKAPDAASILLLIPSHDTGGIPRLFGEPPLPGLHPSHALWMPPTWLANRHNAAA